MNNQKGITLTILVATIAVLAIIIGSISYSSMSSLKMKLYYNMCSDIELLDEKIALYYLQKNELPIKGNPNNVNDLIVNYSENNINYNPNNSGTLYQIDLSKLDNLSLNYTDYYIDETSHTIYFFDGIKVGEELYYTVPLAYQEVNVNSYQ